MFEEYYNIWLLHWKIEAPSWLKSFISLRIHQFQMWKRRSSGNFREHTKRNEFSEDLDHKLWYLVYSGSGLICCSILFSDFQIIISFLIIRTTYCSGLNTSRFVNSSIILPAILRAIAIFHFYKIFIHIRDVIRCPLLHFMSRSLCHFCRYVLIHISLCLI